MQAHTGADREAVIAQPGERVPVRLELEAFARADRVRPQRQRPPRRHRRILLAQRSGRRIARVHERLRAGRDLLLVHAGEALQRQVHLAAHLDPLGQRPGVVGQRERDRPHGAQVGGDVLADHAVAAGGAAGEATALVQERDGEAVDLGLGHELERLAVEQPAQALDPGPELVVGARVREREHRLGVLDLGELARRRRADPLRRRVRRDELGVLGLDRLQLAHPAVVLAVGHRRRIEHVVLVVGRGDQLAQLDGARVRLHHASASSGRASSRSGPSARSTAAGNAPQSAAAVRTPAARPARTS